MPAREKYCPTKFLIIEDDDDHAELISRCFASSSGDVSLTRAIDGEKALALLEGHCRTKSVPPDVVMLDLNIPRVSGLKVLDFIKSSPILKDIVVVVFTTSNSKKDREIAYDLGVNSYVVKPVGFEDFQTSIANIKFYWSNLNVPINRRMEPKK